MIKHYKNWRLSFVILLMISSNQLLAQSREISGTVTSSEDNAVMPGVNILLKGTSTGTITAADGKFTISVDNNSAILEISSIGYATQEIVVGTQTVINVSMVADIKSLAEIVVV